MTANQVEGFRTIAAVLRAAGRAAIEAENAPDKRKRLRLFSIAEAAHLLDVSPAKIRHAAASLNGTAAGPPRTRLAFDEMQALRPVLHGTGPARRLEQGERLSVVAFANFKGGSAKTTGGVHCAQYLALQGYRVLLVDLDSQGSATAQFGLDPSCEVGANNSFAAWTAAREDGRALDPRSLCQRTYWPGIHLVPAGAALAAAEDSLARRAAGPPGPVLPFDELAAFLHAVADGYDIAVVDTRPDVNMLMTAALHAATGLVIPTRATMTDLASTGEFFAHLASYMAGVEHALGRPLSIRFARILVSAYDPADRSQDALLALLRDRFGPIVLPSPFLHSRVMGTAGFGKETIYEYEPSTDRTAYTRVLASANAVNAAILKDIEGAWGRTSAQRGAAEAAP
jgi:chromosome partitioning protein